MLQRNYASMWFDLVDWLNEEIIVQYASTSEVPFLHTKRELQKLFSGSGLFRFFEMMASLTLLICFFASFSAHQSPLVVSTAWLVAL